MKLLIAIPSLSRPHRITEYTLPIVKPLTGLFEWKVFVEPNEYFLYTQYCGVENVVCLDNNGKGLGYSLGFIARYAQEHSFNLILKLDDDIRNLIMVDSENSTTVLKYIIQDIVPDFENDSNLGAVRFIQSRFWLYQKKNIRKYTHKDQVLWGVNMIRTSAHEILSEHVTQFTDTALTLYLWQKGYYTLTYGKCGLDIIQNAGKGGSMRQDRRQNSINTILFLQQSFDVDFNYNSSNPWGIDIDVSNYKKSVVLH